MPAVALPRCVGLVAGGGCLLQARIMHTSQRPAAAFTIVEVMIVIVFLSVAVAMLLPQVNASLDQQVEATGRALVSDLEYARNLALVNNSTYQLTVDADAGQLILEHTGSNTSLDTLPTGPYRLSSDPSDKKITQLDSIPGIATAATFVAMYADGASQTAVNTVEFDSLGATSRSEQTVLIVGAGGGDARRYVTLTINPVTGLVTRAAASNTSGDWNGDAIPAAPSS